jgi:radical SAM superfamily enzyme YgiQ (UPF0313 family)
MSPPRRFFGIVPPTGLSVREDRCQTPIEGLRTIALRPPIDLMYAAAAFEAAGAQARLRDYPAEGLGFDRLERDLLEFAPDLVLLSATTPTLEGDMQAAALVRRAVPSALVAAKGAHFLQQDRACLARWPALDFVFRGGEVEHACREIGIGRALSDVPGLTVRAGGAIVRTPERAPALDLDSLPLPARHLVRNELYTRPDTGQPQTTLVTNRGCPHTCVYCLAGPVSGSTNRYRSVEGVIDEMRVCVERHGIRNFLLRSDLFTQNRAWVMRLCEAILDSRLPVRWACNSRTDTVDAAMLRSMQQAGCWIVAFGVESGDQAALDRLEKRARVADAVRAVAACREAGVRSSVYLLIGLPWDTRETIAAQSRFARELDPDILEVFYPYPFPGTALRRECVERGLLDEGSFPTQAYSVPVFPTQSLSLEELRPLRLELLRRFYMRPGTVLRTLRSAQSLAQLRGFLRTGLAQLKDFAVAG